ncbi:hypothetical protein IscW_ISCW018334 [Ixodes scapularis]|uniref:Uncharacterized protein n=1 Tax=Ixodes scapularis TaxID=6945 RepID=B7PFH7_IXOSC|nr:hypothetical protein IscW_ISCW018334 [Ixodes scapularis]|eukprot:XP_002433949.1 hypothetical protein IscW_ISCW018334 [Ixodes scapularis]
MCVREGRSTRGGLKRRNDEKGGDTAAGVSLLWRTRQGRGVAPFFSSPGHPEKDGRSPRPTSECSPALANAGASVRRHGDGRPGSGHRRRRRVRPNGDSPLRGQSGRPLKTALAAGGRSAAYENGERAR